MLQVFIVSKNYQAEDTESYEHWVGNHDLTYHVSKAGAQAEVDKLISLDVKDMWENSKPRNPHIEDKYWLDCEKTMLANIREFQIGTDRDITQEWPVYSVRAVDVLP